MKKLLSLLTIVAILFVGCKKEEDTSGYKTIIQYEVSSTLPFVAVYPSTSFNLSLGYTDAYGTFQPELSNTTGKIWSKQFELETTLRPIRFELKCSGNTKGFTGTGTVTAKIYENYVLKATNLVDIQATATPGVGFFSLPFTYYVKQ